MSKEEMNFYLRNKGYFMDGTKEACIKAREFLRSSSYPTDNSIESKSRAVSSEEFVQAVKILIASAYLKNDEMPETWYCDSDCTRCTWNIFPCEGEYNLNKFSEKKCPYFRDEGLI